MKMWPFWDQHHHSDSQTTASVVATVANHPSVAPTTPQLQEDKKQQEDFKLSPESSNGFERRDDLHHLLLSPVSCNSESTDSSSSSTTSFSSSSSSSDEDDDQSPSSSSCSTTSPPPGTQLIVRQHNGRNHRQHESNKLLSWWDPTSFFRLLTKPQPLQSSYSRSLASSLSSWSSSPSFSLQPDFFLGLISAGLYHVNLFAYRSWSEIVLRKQGPSMVLDTAMTSISMRKNTMIALKDNQCHDDDDDSDYAIFPMEDDNSICDVSISSEVANSITEYSNYDYDVVHTVPFDTRESNGSFHMPHGHVDHDHQRNTVVVAVETTKFEAKTDETNDDSRLVESPTGIMDELQESFLSMGGRNGYRGDDDGDDGDERSFSSMVVSTSHIFPDCYDDDEFGQEREQNLDDRESNPPFSSVTLQPRTSYEGRSFDNHSSIENEQEVGDTTVTVTPEASTNIHTMTEAPSTLSESPDIDIASHVYGGTKMVWGWSKDHVPLAGIFLGVTEGVANVVVKRVTNGCDLSEVDHQHIQRHLQNLDRGILNPVFRNIFDTVIDESDKLQNQGPEGKNLLQHALTPFFCPAAGFLKDHLPRSPRQAVACN